MPGPISHLLAIKARERESNRPRKPLSNTVVRPPTQEVIVGGDHGVRYSIPQRVQALTLLSLNWSFKDVEACLRIPDRTLWRIKQRAEERGPVRFFTLLALCSPDLLKVLSSSPSTYTYTLFSC
jgi:hypothetical protein